MVMFSFEEIIEKAPKEIQELLEKCKTTPQSPEWHPEAPGDIVPHNVYKHTKIVYNRALKTNDINLIISSIFHDTGKLSVTKPSLKKEGNWSAHGHELVSARLVDKHRMWIGHMGGNWYYVYQIVKEHMRIKLINEMRPSKQKALREHPLYDKFVLFSEFDNMQTLTQEEMNL
jgi:hypothetical protein